MSRVTVSKTRDDKLDQKLLELRRVTRVVAGGKRLSFRAVVVVGDHAGRVGLGVAKGKDVQKATEKALYQAKKKILDIPLTETNTLPFQISAKHSSAKILIKPAPPGKGLIAGGAARVVLSFAGVKNATAKLLGRTPNKLTNAMAALSALKKIKRRLAEQAELKNE